MKIIVPPSSGRSTWAWKIGFNFTNSYALNHLQMTWLDSTRQVEINTIMCNWQGIVHCVKSTCHQSNASDSNEGKITTLSWKSSWERCFPHTWSTKMWQTMINWSYHTWYIIQITIESSLTHLAGRERFPSPSKSWGMCRWFWCLAKDSVRTKFQICRYILFTKMLSSYPPIIIILGLIKCFMMHIL